MEAPFRSGGQRAMGQLTDDTFGIIEEGSKPRFFDPLNDGKAYAKIVIARKQKELPHGKALCGLKTNGRIRVESQFCHLLGHNSARDQPPDFWLRISGSQRKDVRRQAADRCKTHAIIFIREHRDKAFAGNTRSNCNAHVRIFIFCHLPDSAFRQPGYGHRPDFWFRIFEQRGKLKYAGIFRRDTTNLEIGMAEIFICEPWVLGKEAFNSPRPPVADTGDAFTATTGFLDRVMAAVRAPYRLAAPIKSFGDFFHHPSGLRFPANAIPH